MRWIYFGGITLVLAMPQLFFWTFSQTSGNNSFLRYSFNWVNEADPYLWFYIKNWGIPFLFIIPAFFNTSKDNKKLVPVSYTHLLEFITYAPYGFQLPICLNALKFFSKSCLLYTSRCV